jgi:hypothetical protein
MVTLTMATRGKLECGVLAATRLIMMGYRQDQTALPLLSGGKVSRVFSHVQEKLVIKGGSAFDGAKINCRIKTRLSQRLGMPNLF